MITPVTGVVNILKKNPARQLKFNTMIEKTNMLLSGIVIPRIMRCERRVTQRHS
jgi:hypothetical protein